MTAITLNTQIFRARIRDALAPYSAKRLARWANTSHRTAEHWRSGRAVPRGDALLALLDHNDSIAAMLLRKDGGDNAANRDHLGKVAALAAIPSQSGSRSHRPAPQISRAGSAGKAGSA